MIKNTKDKIILILEELILYCEKMDKKSMKDVYESVKEDLHKEKLSNGGSGKICSYFCGYQAHADLADYEYIRVGKIIDFFWS